MSCHLKREPAMPCVLRHSHRRGDTLIEVLVAIVILAFGLLGIAGLMGKNLALENNAYSRTAVTEKIYTLADRMRLNAAGVTAGNYDSYTSPSTAPTNCGQCSNTAASGAVATTCVAASIAAADLCQWSQDLANALPGGMGSVSRANATQFNIAVNWNDPKGNPSAQSYTLTVRVP